MFIYGLDHCFCVQIPDKDLERRRVGQKIDPQTGVIYTEEMYNPERPVKEEKEGDGEEEEEEEEGEEEETGNEVLSMIVVKPDVQIYVQNNNFMQMNDHEETADKHQF